MFHRKGHAIKYPIKNPDPAPSNLQNSLTDIQDAVLNKHIVHGWRKASPLIRLQKFSIVDSFVPDRLHCVDLGVCKQLTEYWLSSSNLPFSISNADAQRIENIMVNCRVPTIIAKLSRSILRRSGWTGLEWLNWAMHYSLPCLSEIPGFQLYLQNWSLFVELLHILMDDSISQENIQRAKYLSLTFMAEVETVYSDDAMSYNVHQLKHLVESVELWGPLWAHSGILSKMATVFCYKWFTQEKAF